MRTSIFRDESTDSVASGVSKQADPHPHGSDLRPNGEVSNWTTTSTDSVVDRQVIGYSTGSPTSTLAPFPTRNGSDAGSPSPLARTFSLKRSGSNIANLRAAFEQTDAPGSAARPLDKSPSRSFSGRSEDISTRSRERDEIANLERQLANEIEKRQLCESQLKVSQERCEQLEKENRSARREQASQVPNDSQGRSTGSQAEIAEEGETRSIQRQLYELKRSISTATRIENQVSDSTFAQDFANLHHELQNFIVNTFRRVKISKTPKELCESLEKVAASKQRGYLQPLFVAFEPSMKLAALQATVVCYIMDVFDEPLLFGLPDQQEWRENLRETMKSLPTILAPSAFNKWRYLTLDAVRQSVGIEEAMHLSAIRLAESIRAVLSALTDVEDFGPRANSLNSIVVRAVQLSHLFKVQRAQYEFALPAPGAPFRSDLMEDHAVDGEALADRTIECATFPSVIKHGDENGDDLLLSNIVVKAKIFCKV